MAVFKLQNIDINIPDIVSENRTPGGEGMHAWFAYPDEMAKYWLGMWSMLDRVISDIPNPFVIEAFGGLGGSTAKHAPRFSKHVAIDWDAGCCAAFKKTNPMADVVNGDSSAEFPLALSRGAFDVILFEQNTGTVMSRFKDQSYKRKIIDPMFSHGAEYIVYVDLSKSKYGIHRSKYTAFYGVEVDDFHSYCRAAAHFFRNNTGYGAIDCVFDGAATTFLLKKNTEPTITGHRTIDLPKNSYQFVGDLGFTIGKPDK